MIGSLLDGVARRLVPAGSRWPLLAGLAAACAAVLLPIPSSSQPRAQTFRICVVDADPFKLKDVALHLSPRPGHVLPIEPVSEETFPECSGDKRFWRFVVSNSLETPGNRAILQLRFASEAEDGAAGRTIDTTVEIPIRLMALNKIGQPDNRIDIWVPLSVPEPVGLAYLDTLERMSTTRRLDKLVHSAILYDRLRTLYGPKADVTRRAARITMDAATGLMAQDRTSETLFDIPDFAVRAIEESLSGMSAFGRFLRRFEESRTAPIVKADQLIRELIRTGQCASARSVLAAITGYVGAEDYLLAEARVPPTHLADLGVKIDRECR